MHTQLNLSSILNKGVEGPVCLTFSSLNLWTKMSLVPFFRSFLCILSLSMLPFFLSGVTLLWVDTNFPFHFPPSGLMLLFLFFGSILQGLGKGGRKIRCLWPFLTSTRQKYKFALNKSSAYTCAYISLFQAPNRSFFSTKSFVHSVSPTKGTIVFTNCIIHH